MNAQKYWIAAASQFNIKKKEEDHLKRECFFGTAEIHCGQMFRDDTTSWLMAFTVPFFPLSWSQSSGLTESIPLNLFTLHFFYCFCSHCIPYIKSVQFCWASWKKHMPLIAVHFQTPPSANQCSIWICLLKFQCKKNLFLSAWMARGHFNSPDLEKKCISSSTLSGLLLKTNDVPRSDESDLPSPTVQIKWNSKIGKAFEIFKDNLVIVYHQDAWNGEIRQLGFIQISPEVGWRLVHSSVHLVTGSLACESRKWFSWKNALWEIFGASGSCLGLCKILSEKIFSLWGYL